MNNQMTKTPMPSQEPDVRNKNFKEVALGYTEEMAVNEAQRCLNCKNKPCVTGCPVNVRIPEFIAKVAEGDFAGAYEVITSTNSLPAVCGRVCPQETQCEGKCVRGIKGEPVAVGRLERFVADWHREHIGNDKVEKIPSNGKKAAVVGAGPAGLTAAGDLVNKGYEVTVFESLHKEGGVLVYGIPEFRLPKQKVVKKEIEKNNKKIVVLDDDPTGVQTVHDISVYTNWEKDTIRQGFDEENNLFYVLTNSRGFTAEQTTKAHNEIAAVVDEVAKETGKEYIFISRSDSTLRGHYPLETELLKKNYEANTGKTIDGEILCPFFKEGGRYTIDNVHYVKYGEELIPANETEFAKDKTFGYSAATMPEYVEEKTKGAYKASDVTCISLEDIHDMNIDKIEEALMEVKDFNKIIVNAVDYADVKVFCVALYRAMAKGKVFMFRTAAAIVKVMGGVTDQPLLSREQMVVKETDNGGIIVVGSHTDKTTKQVEELKKLTDIEFIELDATLVKDDEAFEKEVKRCLNLEETCIKAGKTVCCYTTRALITADTGDKEDELRLSVKISDAVQSLVGRLSVTPSFVIAKGGITSSDVGTKDLAVKKANVLGQIKPGIPVWQTGEESKFPLTPYVIFPGNVGEVTTLREAVEVLTAK